MDTLLQALADGGASTAVEVDGQALSWARLRRDGDRLAAGMRPGERVLVEASPTLRTCVAVAGVLRAGAVLVALNPASGDAERAHVLTDADPHWVLGASGDPTAGPAAGSPPDRPDLGLVVYTSGTTGAPKGAELSLAALAADLDALAEAWEQSPRDRLVHALPLFHVHGLVLGLLGPLRAGFPLWHPGRFTPQAVTQLLGRAPRGTGVLFGVPTTYHRLVGALDGDAVAALARARLLVSGSAALSAADADALARATGTEPLERYGLTETLIVAAARADEPRRRGCVGRPLAGVQISVRDEDGGEIASGGGELGEIWVRGRTLFDGYRGRGPAPLRDGWLATGDVASVEPDGALRIVGRAGSDLVKTGGFKVGTGEVEEALLACPGVLEAAVTGRPDPDLGEIVVAWVVLEPAAFAGADVTEALGGWVSARLAPHKRPRRIVVSDSLPRTPLGKIRKGDLALG